MLHRRVIFEKQDSRKVGMSVDLPILSVVLSVSTAIGPLSECLSLFFALFAEDLQRKSLSGSVSKYSGKDECHTNQPKDPSRSP